MYYCSTHRCIKYQHDSSTLTRASIFPFSFQKLIQLNKKRENFHSPSQHFGSLPMNVFFFSGVKEKQLINVQSSRVNYANLHLELTSPGCLIMILGLGSLFAKHFTNRPRNLPTTLMNVWCSQRTRIIFGKGEKCGNKKIIDFL